MVQVYTKYLLAITFLLGYIRAEGNPGNDSLPDPVLLSGKLLYSASIGDPDTALERSIANLDPNQLKRAILDSGAALAFWLNLYNAFTQIALTRNPDRYENRGKFFRTRQFVVAGKRLSLDAIEHGLLRRSAIKWGLGYLRKPFPGKFEKEFRIDKPDPRIHFALNCGAKSCPPVAYYETAKLHQQLNMAARNYLLREVVYDSVRNRVVLPAVFSWFRGDFGCKSNIYHLLRSYRLIPAGKKPAIRFKKYDWEMQRSPLTEQSNP